MFIILGYELIVMSKKLIVEIDDSLDTRFRKTLIDVKF